MPDSLPDSIQLHENEGWSNVPKSVHLDKVERQYDLFNHGPIDPVSWHTGVANIARVIRDAEVAKKRLRAVGAAWSLSPVAAGAEYLAHTLQLNQIFAPFRASDLRAGVRPESLVYAQCGARVSDLHLTLQRRGQSLRTVGSSDGQSLAGCFSTGTHGSGLEKGSIADYVRALYLVVDGGRPLWLERASEPIASPDFVKAIGLSLVQDDELFDAAVVSFGSFGIIHAAVLEVEPLFVLHRERKREPLRALRETIRTLEFPVGTPRPYHFDVVINPHDVSEAYATRYYPTNRPPTVPAAGAAHNLGDEVGSVLAGLLDVAPALLPAAIGPLMRAVYGEADVDGTLGDLFQRTITPRYSPISTEFAVALPDAERALDVALGVIQGLKPGYFYPGVIGIRYVRKTRATLGFTRFPISCTFELPALGGVRGNQTFYRRLWAALDASQIAYTLHWGQLNDSLDAASVRRMYGKDVERWVQARRRLLGESGCRTFANDFLERVGLAG